MPTLQLPDYNIHIGAISNVQVQWLTDQKYTGIAVLADTNTARDCWPLLSTQLAHLNPVLITIPAGEIHKTLDSCQYIWEALFNAGASRKWCLLNLGGGVIGDMGGFCAGTFKRGMDFIQIPTTLLSQVDASVGGKLGIDFFGIKNSIGLFQNPQSVWADPNFFSTLPPRELRSGFAEIIKHALIADKQQWEEIVYIEDLNTIDWATWVDRSVEIKRQIVTKDPYEKGLRKALNFGHTIGHAIESYFLTSESPLLHGEAIAAGMICETYLSVQQQNLNNESLKEITQFILKIYGHQYIPDTAWPDLVTSMNQDKKNENHHINFSLLPSLGQVVVNQTASLEAIRASINYYNNLI